MRILCLLNRELAGNVALNLLLPALAGHQVLVGLSEASRGASQNHVSDEARELHAAEYAFANDLLFPLVERAALPDAGTRFLTFGEVERWRGIRCVPLPNANTPEGLAHVQAFAPDLIVTIRYRSVLRRPVIDLPRLGVLNLHSALLPTYRGILGTMRALTNGDAEIGCTLHFITDPTIDTGPIVGRARIPTDRRQSLLWHILALYPPGIRMLSDALRTMSDGRALAVSGQPAGEGAYYSRPTAAEWTAFRNAGWEVVRVQDLVDVARAYHARSG